MSTASSIRSGRPETCFQHVPFSEILRPSEKLKENLLAAYAEVDRIDWALDAEQSPSHLQYLAGRLVTIQDFNNALADYIVKKVSEWEKYQSNKEFPSLEEYRKREPRGDYQHDKALAEFARQKSWEEVFQVKELGPFSEQLSVKITRVFQKAPLAEFQFRLTEPVKIAGQIPEIYRLFWHAPKIEGERPQFSSVTSTTTQSTASSSSTSASSSSSVSQVETVQQDADPVSLPVTARIIVNFEGSEGDKLYIRGTGPNMSWGPGIEMRKEGGQWIYESTEPFETFQFKVALNDHIWESGDNHTVESGKPVEISSVSFHPPA